MFSKLHERLGTAGLVVAVIALVVALGGSAVAALSGAEKKEIKKHSKQFSNKFSKKYSKQFSKKFSRNGRNGATGPAGPQGLPGPAGPVGPAGPAGPAGSDGEDGEDGKDGATGPAGPAGDDGATGPTGPAGADGATGPTGPAGPSCPEGPCFLPSESTSTGTWSVTFAGEEAVGSISFVLPLEAPLDNAHVKIVTGAAPAECDDGSGTAPSAGNPEADPGYLCVYPIAFEPSGEISLGGVINPTTFATGAGTMGAALLFTGGAAGGFGLGTYAVTAP